MGRVIREEIGPSHSDAAMPVNFVTASIATRLQAKMPAALRLRIDESGSVDLEAEVAECLVGFGHAVHFVTLLHGAATAFSGLEQFVGQALGHGLFATLAGGFLDPAHRQSHAKKHGNDLVFLDTAGRLHIDEELMQELRDIRDAVEPAEILLVVDAMTGQDAVNAASAFDEALGVTGVMLTKLDGDARGGAALSIRAATGKPIKFAGTGEKLDMIEPFHPDRMASRILGMGDMLTLIEKAEQSFDEKKALEMADKLRANRFSLQDYLDQMGQLKNMGDLSDVAAMIPGVDAKALKGAQMDDKAIAHTEAIIRSMTKAERDNPEILNSSRKKRIAAGCGLQVVDVNRLIKQFGAMQQMMKQMSGKNLKKFQKKFGTGGMGGMGGLPGGLGF
jgi:signal recognition particle subunit SRP54